MIFSKYCKLLINIYSNYFFSKFHFSEMLDLFESLVLIVLAVLYNYVTFSCRTSPGINFVEIGLSHIFANFLDVEY